VITRTLLEWEHLPYGEGEDALRPHLADRLAKVAAASPLAGRGGAHVLEHRRHDLRAGQVVGVVAAEGATLEILPKIDFPEVEGGQATGRIREQLVHMLAVALDLDIASGRMAALGLQRENLLEVLIGLFAAKLTEAVRHGMPRRYVGHEEDLPVLRGRLDVRRQFTALAMSPDRLACRFDALSADIALNQIMKAAVTRLAAVARARSNQRSLRELGHVYTDISPVPVRSLRWDDVILDRTSKRWRGLVNLARLLLGDRFQTTSTGSTPGFSLLFEMNTLFEEYVTEMLRRALSGTGARVRAQGGRLYCLRDEADAPRFQTRPDILVERAGQTFVVIDTKWKRLNARIDDPKQGVSQADVYQMMAYGRLYACPRLVLLYPHHAKLAAPAPLASRHRIALPDCADTLTVASVDVSSHTEALRCLQALTPDLVPQPEMV